MFTMNEHMIPQSYPYQVPTLWQTMEYAVFTVVAFAAASPIVARVWSSYKRKCDKEPAETYETPCEYRYPIEEAMDDGEIPTSSYVMEYTPNGSVLMKYNADNEQFEYWGARSVQYKYLETIARKFVTSFHCSRIYHDWNPYEKKETSEKPEPTESTEKPETTTNPPEPSEPSESVFASFKTYNTSKARQNKNTNKVRNHYVHKGTLSEWYESPQSQKDTTKNENVGIDFSTYKSMFFN